MSRTVSTLGHQNSWKSHEKYQNVVAVMQQVQNCSWNPFKLNEIVTLERCLREVSEEDPRVGLILRKIANECVFVEPDRKLQYLSRGEDEKRTDLELKKQASVMIQEANEIDNEIERFKAKLAHLSDKESESSLQIDRLEKTVLSMKCAHEASVGELEFLLGKVISSFERSIVIIRDVAPTFIQSLPQSQLVKQFESIPASYRRCISKLVKNGEAYRQQQQLASQLSFFYKKNMCNQLNKYLNSINSLNRDLQLIDKVYSSDIPEEIEYMRVIETHVDYLKQPLRNKAPKKVSVIYHDLNPLDLPVLTAGPPERDP